jgi:hypothetical protein
MLQLLLESVKEIAGRDYNGSAVSNQHFSLDLRGNFPFAEGEGYVKRGVNL